MPTSIVQSVLCMLSATGCARIAKFVIATFVILSLESYYVSCVLPSLKPLHMWEGDTGFAWAVAKTIVLAQIVDKDCNILKTVF